jgi:hypothetical protein
MASPAPSTPAPSLAALAFENAAQRCTSCGSPAEAGAAWCAACGSPLARAAAPPPVPPPPPAAPVEILTAGFQCESCGATVQCEPGRRAQACAFCGSTYVVELPGSSLAHLVPEFVLSFRQDQAQAAACFSGWCGKGFFTPGDVRALAAIDRLQGVFLPFWTFSMKADSTWEADIGEHWYETVSSRDSKGRRTTRRVQHTEWHPLSGRHHSFHFHHLVSGSTGLAQGEAQAVLPFDLTAMQRYRPELLAGWLAEPFSVTPEAALAACQEAFIALEGERIRAFLPGDTHKGLEWTTTFDQVSEDLLLLPFWIGAYRYRGKLYRFVMNGQTGKATGTRPRSVPKILAVIFGVLLLIVVMIVLFLLAEGS